MRPRRRDGVGTSVKMLNIGTIDLPLLRSTSLVSHRGLGMPSKGEPSMPANVGLSTEVDAGTVTPVGAPLEPLPTTSP